MDDFDVNKIRAEIWASRQRSAGGPRLSFGSRCAVLAALYQGFKPWVVAQAFGVSENTAFYIGGCIDDVRAPVTMERIDSNGNLKTHVLGDPNISRMRRDKRIERYPEVKAELERLGVDGFIAAYYTPGIHERLIQARNQARPKRDTWKPNPKANEYEGDHKIGYWNVPVRIAWFADKGWAWTQLNEDGSQDGWEWKGIGESYPDDEGFKGFRTSAAAFVEAKKLLHAE